MRKIHLLPDGPTPRPVFQSRAAYQKFRESFQDAMAPRIEASRRAHAASQHEAQSRFVG